MMFEPEKVISKITKYSPIKDWVHYENYGVYSIHRFDGIVEYYLVEKKYRHGLNVMLNTLQVKLSANRDSQEAKNLIWKITTQIRNIRESMKRSA